MDSPIRFCRQANDLMDGPKDPGLSTLFEFWSVTKLTYFDRHLVTIAHCPGNNQKCPNKILAGH